MKRNQSLDALRGIAILLVIGFHVGAPGLRRVGWIGVDLFFVLSGFLISGLLFRDYETLGTIRLGRFWFRRAFKILPPLYAFLAVFAALTLATHTFNARPFLRAALFYTNYTVADVRPAGMLWHTWSLAVEEHFYLLCPLLFFVLVRLRQSEPFRWLPFIAAGLYGTCFALRLAAPDPRYATHLRVDALFAGVTLRYLHSFCPTWFQRLRNPIVLLLGLTFWIPAAFQFSGSPSFQSFVLAWTSLAAALLLAWCYNHDAANWWSLNALRTLAGIGFFSYSIYLWHLPITLFLRDMQPAIFFKTSGFVFCIATGVVMSKLIEMPSLRLRERVDSLAKARAAAHTTNDETAALASHASITVGQAPR